MARTPSEIFAVYSEHHGKRRNPLRVNVDRRGSMWIGGVTDARFLMASGSHQARCFR
ncbi:MAG: hypothetical protein WA510_17525 [Acidobacteriaceae bacterium]